MMTRRPSLRRVRAALLGAALLAVASLPAVTRAADSPELTSETQRFLAVYPVSAMQATQRKMTLQIARQMGSKVTPGFVACMNAALVPSVFDPDSLALARKNFTDAARLKAINDFMESPAGTKFRQYGLHVLETGLKQLEAGQSMKAPPQPAYTSAETAAIRAFGATEPAADFGRFGMDLIQQYQRNDAGNDRVWTIISRCGAQ